MNNLPRLISISGAAGSGKDTVAQMIQEITNGIEKKTITVDGRILVDPDSYSYFTRRFAGKLKRIAGILLNVPTRRFEDHEFKESYLSDFDMTVRSFLQKLGTESLRECLHQDIWVNSLFREFDDSSRWIVVDTRFENEHRKIKELGGICIRISRTNLAIDHSHISENEWRDLPFDYTIDNSRDLDHLRQEVQKMLEHYK